MESQEINSSGESCSFCGRGHNEHGQETITVVRGAGQRIRICEACKTEIAESIEKGIEEDYQTAKILKRIGIALVCVGLVIWIGVRVLNL